MRWARKLLYCVTLFVVKLDSISLNIKYVNAEWKTLAHIDYSTYKRNNFSVKQKNPKVSQTDSEHS